MIQNFNENSPALERALKNLEQARARYEAERKKQNEKRRKAENHHKYMMGGIIVKYFPECYQYEQNELEGILSSELSSPQFREAVKLVQAVRDSASDPADAADAGAAEERQDGYGNRWGRGRGSDRYAGHAERTGGGYADMEEPDAWEDSYGEDR